MVADEVFKNFAAGNEVALALVPKDFGRAVTRVVVGGHGETVSTGVVETEDIAFVDFVDPAVGSKGVGLADVADHRVETFAAFGITEVFNMVLGVVEHGSDKVVESGVNLGKDGGGGLFDHVDFCQEKAGLAN